MKNLIFAILAVSLGAYAFNKFAGANEPLAEENKSSAWTENYEAALATAKENDKMVLLNFTGSDWCPPCMHMESTVLHQDNFISAMEGKVVLVTLDFPRRTEQSQEIKERNQSLAEEVGVRGFPTFVLIDNEGNEIRRTVGAMRGGPEAFISWVKEG
ncbi:MAG: thioredoxin family protein [Opitutales bacterium]|nr:thioredoxin family protein [Opitutales bacterium]MCH8539539.1 thioredoxin family protein [Opitutales bacterium]